MLNKYQNTPQQKQTKPQPPSRKRKMKPTLLLLSLVAIVLLSQQGAVAQRASNHNHGFRPKPESDRERDERERKQNAILNHAICKLHTCPPEKFFEGYCTQAARTCFQFAGAESTACPIRSQEDLKAFSDYAYSHPKCALFRRERGVQRRLFSPRGDMGSERRLMQRRLPYVGAQRRLGFKKKLKKWGKKAKKLVRKIKKFRDKFGRICDYAAVVGLTCPGKGIIYDEMDEDLYDMDTGVELDYPERRLMQRRLPDVEAPRRLGFKKKLKKWGKKAKKLVRKIKKFRDKFGRICDYAAVVGLTCPGKGIIYDEMDEDLYDMDTGVELDYPERRLMQRRLPDVEAPRRLGFKKKLKKWRKKGKKFVSKVKKYIDQYGKVCDKAAVIGVNCPGKGIIYDEMDDEEAGGFSVEAGYEKDGYNANIKYENDEMEDAPYRPWTRDSNWDEMDDEGGLRRHEALTQFWDEFADDE